MQYENYSTVNSCHNLHNIHTIILYLQESNYQILNKQALLKLSMRVTVQVHAQFPLSNHMQGST